MTRIAAALLLALAAAGCASSRAPVLPEEWSGGPEEWSGGSPADEGEYGEYGEPRHRSWEERDRLHTTLMPYAWRTSARGDAVVKSVPASFDEGPDGQASFAGRVEVYSERVGFFLDGFYTTVSHRDAGVEFDDRVAVFDFGSAMRILGGEPWQMTGERPAADFELDGLALIRNHFLKMDATPAGAFSANSEDEYWFDLVFGMRGAVVLLGRLSLFGKIDGGGMALNQWNSWTWSADAGAKLRITRNLGAVAAYRWFASHWEDGQPEVVINPLGAATLDSSRDIRIQGPWLGIVLEF